MLALDSHRCALAGAVTLALSCVASAQTRSFCISTSNDLLTRVASAQPGDTLVLGPGLYQVPQLVLRGRRGTPDQWIVLRSASATQRAVIDAIGTGPVVCIDDCSYVRLEDLEITITGPGSNRHGVCFSPGTASDHVVVDHCHIHDVSGHGIGSEATSLQHLTVQACEISDCGRRGIDLGTLGSQQTTVAATIRDNLIQRTRDGSGGHGIHIKPPSYTCTIEDNVLIDTGTSLGAGIVTYHAGPNELGGRPRSEWHTIRRNVVFDLSGASNQGIYAVNSAVITDNVVFCTQVGISIYKRYSTDVVDNLIVAHNTLYGCRSAGVELKGGAFAPTCVIVNNAAVVELPGQFAYDGDQGLGAATFTSNGAYGPVWNIRSGILTLGAPPTLFANATCTVPGIDLYPLAPSSGLIGSAQVAPPSEYDFNGVHRPATGADLGAYQSSGTGNPGWAIDRTFKASLQDLRPTWAQIVRSGRVDWTLTTHDPAARFYVLLASATGARDHPIPLVWDPLTDLVFDPALATVFRSYLGAYPPTTPPALDLGSVPFLPCHSLTVYHCGVFLDAGLRFVGATGLARVVLNP